MSNDQTILLGGRYRLDRRIATGGMGEVWSATDVVLDRVVAAKTLQAGLMDEPGFLERFRAEARHAASLSHPGIAAVYDYGEANGHAFLVMEMVDGRTLSHVLASDAPLAPDRAASILAQTCDALAAAHAAGVVHRDVKPGNIMLTPDDRVKITDFGISTLVGSVPLTATGQILGTPQYISPEQATGSSATPASDIYSLGVIGYEMLSGRRPFQADTPVGFAMAHVHRTPPPLPDSVPSRLAAMVGEMMVKDPSGRAADAAALSQRFRASSGSTPTQTTEQRSEGDAVTVLHTGVQQPATAFDPRTTIAPMPATIVGALEQPGRQRSTPAIVAFVLVSMAVVAALVVASRGGGGDPGPTAIDPDATTVLGASPTITDSVADAVTVVPESIVANTPAPTTVVTTAPPITVAVFDPASVVGLDHDEAKRRLQEQGYEVREERSTGAGGDKNTVVDARLEPGSGPMGRIILVVSDGKDGDDANEDDKEGGKEGGKEDDD